MLLQTTRGCSDINLKSNITRDARRDTDNDWATTQCGDNGDSVFDNHVLLSSVVEPVTMDANIPKSFNTSSSHQRIESCCLTLEIFVTNSIIRRGCLHLTCILREDCIPLGAQNQRVFTNMCIHNDDTLLGVTSSIVDTHCDTVPNRRKFTHMV